MTSFGASKEITEPGFMPTFKIQGQVYHRIGSLLPVNEEHTFMQIYFIENRNDQLERRLNLFSGLRRNILEGIQNELLEHNNLITTFKTALDTSNRQNVKIIIKPDKIPTGEHPGRFNAPSSSEVAVLMVNQDHGNRDIVLSRRDNEKQRICETHKAYDALQYPLLFPRGEDGYHITIPKVDPITRQPMLNGKYVSACDYYAFQFMVRNNTSQHLFRAQKLLNQYAVDMYAKIEAERLLYIKTNQNNLRSESYIHLQDAIANDVNISERGTKVILPSSFTGSPRYMHMHTQDTICIARKYGRPDLFITFTCNSKWSEIQNALLPTNTDALYRHDIIARVFRLKHLKLIDLIKKGEVFGPILGYVYDRFQGTIPKFLQMRLKIRVGFWLFVLYFSKPKFRPDFRNEVKNTKNVYFCRI